MYQLPKRAIRETNFQIVQAAKAVSNKLRRPPHLFNQDSTTSFLPNCQSNYIVDFRPATIARFTTRGHLIIPNL